MTNGLSGPRKQFLDVLRVLATCAVVLMHVLTGATDVTDASIVPEYRSLLLSVMDLVTWCVPIFLLMSGYLFLNPERTLTYPVMIKKYCRRIALAILLFGVPYAASELVVAERTFRIRMIPEALKMTLVSVFDLVFISDHAASEKSAAGAAGVGCCGSDGSDLLRKQCGTVSE